MTYCPLILIVDDSPTDLQCLSEMLNADYRIKVAHNGRTALAVASTHPPPDLILLDIVMHDMDGFSVSERLQLAPLTRDIPVVFFTGLHDAAQEARALGLRAADYITKPYAANVARVRIRNALLAKSKPPVSPPSGLTHPALLSAGHASTTAGTPHLGKREIEVMTLIAEGLTSAEIAIQLFIAKGTVEVHRENIMRKIGVHNVAAMVTYGVRNGFLGS
jgi:DNA-binding NarL/FixJ family response regulator